MSEDHTCKHETTLESMSHNIEKICKQMDDIHKEMFGPPGSPGIKAKVESQGNQIKGVAGVLGLIGAALLGLFAKMFLQP